MTSRTDDDVGCFDGLLVIQAHKSFSVKDPAIALDER